MKKFMTMALVAAIAIAVSCSKETAQTTVIPSTEQEESVISASKLTFNLAVMGESKAMKTVWETGDRILVYFDDASTKAASSVSQIKFVELTYDGSEWVANTDGAPSELSAKGDCKAIFIPYSSGAITAGEKAGEFCFADVTTYWLETSGATYTCVDNVVSAALSLQAPDYDFAQIYSELDRTKEWTLTVKGSGRSGNKFDAGLKPITGLVFQPSTLSFSIQTGEYGDVINGLNYASGTKGVVFYGLAGLGADKSLVFELVRMDRFFHYIRCSYNVKEFGKGTAVKLTSDLTNNWINAADGQKTLLYGDGTLIIAEQAADRAYNTLVHGGTVKKVYANNETLTRGADAPDWAVDPDNPLANITAVEFGKVLKPTNLNGAFKTMTSLKKIQAEKLDVSNCTNMCGTFDGDNKLEALDVSNWNVAKVTRFDYTFRNCSKVPVLDLSKWTNNVFTRCENMFFGCMNVVSLDLSGLDCVKLTRMDNMFGMPSEGTPKLTTVFVSGKWSTTGVTTGSYGSNVFQRCYSIVGGNGTAWDKDKTDKTYARIDAEGTPGYFTAK